MFAHAIGHDAELRPLEPWHAEELLACVERAREHLSPWTFVASRVQDLASARRLLRDYAHQHARDTAHYTGIWLGGRLVGVAMLRAFDTHAAAGELGGWLVPEAQGHGLATRALAYLTDWAIGERGIQRVQLQTSPRNPHGRALARRLGMTCEGTLRGAIVVNGVRHDSEIWALLAHEWPNSGQVVRLCHPKPHRSC